MLVLTFDGSCYVKPFVVSCARHTYNKVVWHGRQLRQCFLASGNLGETRRVAQGKRGVFIEDFLIDASVVLQHESVIRVGD